MKPWSMTLALVALGVGSAFAADPSWGPPPERRGPPIEKLAAELQLDEYQKGEVTRIFEEQRAKMDAERQQFMASGERPSREQMRQRMQQMEADLLAQLQSVLTADQLAKFKKLMAERREHMRDGPPPPGE